MMRSLIAYLPNHSHRITLIFSIVVFIVAASLGIRSGNELRYPDEYDYHHLAQSIRSGEGYSISPGVPTAFRPPGWPIVLSAIYSVSPQPLAAKVLNAIALACVAWLLSIAVARVVPEGRMFAPILTLLYPVGLYTASTLYPQTFGTLLFVTILLLLHGEERNLLKTGIAGILFGALVLTIPAFLLLSPIILAGMFLTRLQEPPRLVVRSVLFLLCAGFVIAPWTLRNARVFDRFIPISTNSGINLLLGNSENTGPNQGVNVDISHYIGETAGMREDEKDAYFKNCALSWIRSNPADATRLYVLKVFNYFNFRNEMFVQSEASRWRSIVLFLSYYPLLLLAVLRLLAFRVYRSSPFELSLYLLYFGNAFASAIFFTRIRFRMPLDAILIAMVSMALGLLVREISERRTT